MFKKILVMLAELTTTMAPLMVKASACSVAHGETPVPKLLKTQL